MRPLHGTAELAASHILAAHVPSASIQNPAAAQLRQRKLHRFLALPISFSGHREASGLRASVANRYVRVFQRSEGTILNELGGGGREAWLWRSTGSSLHVGGNFGSKATGKLGLFVDAMKHSVVCHQCRTTLSGGSLACLSTSTTSYGGGGGRGIGGRGAGGGGGGGGDGFEARASKGAAAVGGEQSDELPVGSDSGDDVIILDVGGMSCGGCSASVKRILESQPQVLLAKVNLATETAFVQIAVEGQPQGDWAVVKQEIGDVLAKHLTTCGFKSSVREVVI